MAEKPMGNVVEWGVTKVLQKVGAKIPLTKVGAIGKALSLILSLLILVVPDLKASIPGVQEMSLNEIIIGFIAVYGTFSAIKDGGIVRRVNRVRDGK